ncbi:hypothetical protein AXF42_Ash008633 [Apostasia shenzhenica]|uniref:Uncharacterized protein n=1 Tax=Apostasia shenzhenica TaxID=1088818 RepID=A0A2I0B1Z6_9ASPA|nr:hypothetical protein AXF42_Ash008633 [Apostasia shenzhenica]
MAPNSLLLLLLLLLLLFATVTTTTTADDDGWIQLTSPAAEEACNVAVETLNNRDELYLEPKGALHLFILMSFNWVKYRGICYGGVPFRKRHAGEPFRKRQSTLMALEVSFAVERYKPLAVEHVMNLNVTHMLSLPQ